MKIEEIRHRLSIGDSVYLIDRFEDVVIRLSPDSKGSVKSFIKRRGRSEVPIERTSRVVFDAELEGESITEDEYNRFQ